jgi:hypothetical protein
VSEHRSLGTEEVLFEARARGFPPAVAFGALYGLALLWGFVQTLQGTTLTMNVNGFTYRLPVLLPIFGVLGAVELYRVALWRSRTYVVTPTSVILLRGVFRHRVKRSLARSDADRVEVDRAPPRVLAGGSSLALDGLDREDAIALDHVLRGAREAPRLEPRPAPRSRRALALVALVLAGVSAEALARSQRARADEFGALAPVVEKATTAAAKLSKLGVRRRYVERVAADESLAPGQRKWLEDAAQYAANGPDVGSTCRDWDRFLLGQGKLELEVELSAPSLREGVGSYPIRSEPRIKACVRCVSDPSYLPRPPLVEVVLEGSPDDDILLGHLAAQLGAQHVPFTVKRRDGSSR